MFHYNTHIWQHYSIENPTTRNYLQTNISENFDEGI